MEKVDTGKTRVINRLNRKGASSGTPGCAGILATEAVESNSQVENCALYIYGNPR